MQNKRIYTYKSELCFSISSFPDKSIICQTAIMDTFGHFYRTLAIFSCIAP